MSNVTKVVREYLIILIVTLVAAELLSFSFLVWRSAQQDDTDLGQAIVERINQHPLLDRRVEQVKQKDRYLFFPTTQYTFRANTTFSDLAVGRHGFILNGPEEPAGFPGKPAGLVRIVILGGSSVAGATASGNDKTIAAQLEKLLNADRDASRPFQVLNFGMGGNYSYGEVAKLITEVAYLEPDVVIMFDGFNDAHYANLEHLRAELDAPLMNWADFSYHYFDVMTGLRGGVRSAPIFMTYSYLLVESFLGESRRRSVREQRNAIYDALPARSLSDWIAAGDPQYHSVLRTNVDFAAAWAARNDVGFIGYLQPHPWEYKDLSCERAADTKLMIGRLGRSMDESRYAETMRAAFQGYAEAYSELDKAYEDSARVRFIDMRRLFADANECIYNDPIHYNDEGNLAIAMRMRDDLMESGLISSKP
jgi:hypothetical protein